MRMIICTLQLALPAVRGTHHLPKVTKSTFPRIQPSAHKHIHYVRTSENEHSSEKLKKNRFVNKVIFKRGAELKFMLESKKQKLLLKLSIT